MQHDLHQPSSIEVKPYYANLQLHFRSRFFLNLLHLASKSFHLSSSSNMIFFANPLQFVRNFLWADFTYRISE